MSLFLYFKGNNMKLENIYLGGISIVTNKYIDEVCSDTVRDIKLYKIALLFKIKGGKNSIYEDLETNEKYTSNENVEIGGKFRDKKYELISFEDIVERKYMSKKKVLQIYKLSKNMDRIKKRIG